MAMFNNLIGCYGHSQKLFMKYQLLILKHLKMKKQLFSILFALIMISVFGQDFNLITKTDFQQYISEKEIYYNTIIAEKGTDDGIEGYKAFKRWQARYQEEVYNDGGLANVLEAQGYFNKNYNTIKLNFDTYDANWEELGPFSPPLTMGGEYSSASGTGRIFFIEFDPSNSNRIFAGSPTGGLFISVDHGETWKSGGTENLPNPGISHFQMAPATSNTPETWFILTGDGDNNWSFSYGVFRSQDQGQTWESISDGIVLPPVAYWYKTVGRKLLINPNNLNELFVIFNNGLYKTNNALDNDCLNVHWDRKNDEHFTDICSKPNSNNQFLYAATRDTILYSDDYGENWGFMPNQNQIIFLDTTPYRRIILRTTPAKPEILYTVIISKKDSSHSQIYKYNTLTQNWTAMGGLMVDDFAVGWGRYQAFAVSPVNKNTLYQARVWSIHESLDGGLSWSTKSTAKHDDTHWICFENGDPLKMWLGTDGGVSYSYNSCDTIINKSTNISVGNITRLSTGETLSNEIIYGGFDTGSNLSKGESDDWKLLGSGDGYGSIIDDTDPLNPIYYITANAGSPTRIDGGNMINCYIPALINVSGWNHSIIKDYNTQSTIYYAGKKRIGRSMNKGDSWDAISPIAGDSVIYLGNGIYDTLNYIYREVFNAKNHPNYLYTYRVTGIRDWNDYSANKLYKSTNANETDPLLVSWTDITPVINNTLQEFWWSDIAVNHDDPDEIWICKNGYSDTLPKVLHYENNQWTNITHDANNTLQYLSVTAIKHVDGNDDLLIIGTNAGVFFRSNTNPIWTKMEGIPNVRVTEIYIQDGVKKILVSTYGRGVWRGDIPCILPEPDVNITSNTTWSNDTLIPSNIYIKSGNQLSINNCKVLFAPNKSIIVETGAKLFLNGAVLDSRCSDLWGGIQVWGNSNLSQSPSSNQGAIRTNYNTIIKNAQCGIRAIRFDDEVHPQTGGGILIVQNTKFINNRIGISISHYNQFPNTGIITNCHFLINNNLQESIYSPKGIELYLNSKVAIVDNEFLNSNINLNGIEKGIGISIRSGSATINKQSTGNSFNGWNYGINARSSFPAQYIGIKDNTFENCITGAYLSAISNSEIIFNDFDIYENHSGLYIDNCISFTIEENSFESGYLGLAFPSIGMVINNTGDNINEIYKNSFSHINHAILAQNSNRNTAGLGLSFKCNTFSNNAFDIAVTADNSGSNMGIAANQGASGSSSDAPAGNIFSRTGPTGTFTDLNNEESFFTYYYHYYLAENLEPQYYTDNTIEIELNTEADWDENSCPSNYSGGGSGGGIGEIKGRMASSGDISDSLNIIYESLKDGGNTIALQSDVGNSIPPETMEVYNELISTSPYLSDTVVEASIYKENVLPNALLRDIMVANPQSAKNNELIEAIDDRSQAMPDYMKAQILQGKSLIGAMEELLAIMAYHKQIRSAAYKSCVNWYLNDTLAPEASYDSLLLLLATEPQIDARYQLAALQLQKGEIAQANTTIDNISTEFTINANELEAYMQMQDYFALLINLQQNNTSIYNLNEQELLLLEDLETMGNGAAKVYARNIRLNLGLSAYQEPYIFPNLNKSSAAQLAEQKIMQSLNDFHYITVFPNPTKNYIIVDYTLDKPYDKALLQLTNLSGKIIYSQNIYGDKDQIHIDIRNYKAGNYMLSLIVDNKVLETIKVSIIK